MTLKVADRGRHPAGDHPALPGNGPPRRDPRPRSGPHRPELRLRAQRGLLHRPRGAPAGPLPRCRHQLAGHGSQADPHPDRGGHPRGATRCAARPRRHQLVYRRGDGQADACAGHHMEAGNRCFDENVPEETNRRPVDHVADFNLVYTEHARRNLLAEGLHPRRIIKPARRCARCSTPPRPDRGLDGPGRARPDRGRLPPRQCHREENVDLPVRLRALLDCLVAARDATGLPVFVSTHPRTRKRLEALPWVCRPRRGHLQRAAGLPDYNRLQLGAACVLERLRDHRRGSRPCSGFPAVTLRDSIERPGRSTPAASSRRASTRPMSSRRSPSRSRRVAPDPVSDTSPRRTTSSTTPPERVVSFIVSTARRHHQWAGIRSR